MEEKLLYQSQQREDTKQKIAIQQEKIDLVDDQIRDLQMQIKQSIQLNQETNDEVHDVKTLINLELDQAQVNKEQSLRTEIEMNDLEQAIDDSQ